MGWLLSVANRCAHVPITAADCSEDSEIVPLVSEMNELLARTVLAAELDEIIWLLASMKG